MRLSERLVVLLTSSAIMLGLGWGCNLNVDPAVVQDGLQELAAGWVDCACQAVTGLAPLGTDGQAIANVACDVIGASVDVSIDELVPDAPAYPN
jgi:hypothetical protein